MLSYQKILLYVWLLAHTPHRSLIKATIAPTFRFSSLLTQQLQLPSYTVMDH